MGKKLKKQARKHRLAEARRQAPKREPKKKQKPLPLRLQPIIFVRGDDYEPVKYGMGDARAKGAPGAEDVESGGEDAAGEESESAAGVESEDVEDVESGGEGAAGALESALPRALARSNTPPKVEPATSPVISDFEADYFDGSIDISDSVGDSDSVYPHGPLDDEEFARAIASEDSSEIYFSDCSFANSTCDYVPVEGTSYFGDYAVLSDAGSDAGGMAQDIDYNDMEMDELKGFSRLEDEYDFGMDSDADDIIAGILAGESLGSYADAYAAAGRPRRKQKRELSKRQRARLEAKEAARAINFGKCPPLWQRYPEKMTVGEVVQELQQLIYTSAQELRFPPLDHNANWYVSELAKLHGLKVKSYTAAKANCVLVLKTSRAMAPEGPNRSKMGQLMHRRQTFPRADQEKAAKEPKQQKETKGSRPKEGDIVGDKAEAVAEGFGHRIMQQMGWSTGTGLGILRDGIQEPLLARVKLTKAGLRE